MKIKLYDLSRWGMLFVLILIGIGWVTGYPIIGFVGFCGLWSLLVGVIVVRALGKTLNVIRTSVL